MTTTLLNVQHKYFLAGICEALILANRYAQPVNLHCKGKIVTVSPNSLISTILLNLCTNTKT